MSFDPEFDPMDDPENSGEPPRPPQSPTYHQEVQHSSATARVPEHIGGGVFATGAIVMHGMHEFVIDFIQSLSPPKRIVARVALPPTVIPLFVAALQDNIAKYRQHVGPLQRPPMPGAPPVPAPPTASAPVPAAPMASPNPAPPQSIESGQIVVSPTSSGPTQSPPPQFVSPGSVAPPPQAPPITDVYQQLKLPDEILSGVYANTVMIVHGLAEFCFDFITSFYPRSAVSCRVCMAAPHALELLESLKRSMDQFRQKQMNPPPRPPE